MSSHQVLKLHVFKDASWWHWALTIPLLAASLAGHSWAIVLAMVLCVATCGYFFFRTRRWRPYPVQVRIAYLALLATGTLPGMHWIHWIQLIGTTAMVTVGYCPLIRTLSLAPFNRSERLSFRLVKHAFLQEPCSGGLLQWAADTPNQSAGKCSMMPTPDSSISCSFINSSGTSKEQQHAQAH